MGNDSPVNAGNLDNDVDSGKAESGERENARLEVRALVRKEVEHALAHPIYPPLTPEQRLDIIETRMITTADVEEAVYWGLGFVIAIVILSSLGRR